MTGLYNINRRCRLKTVERMNKQSNKRRHSKRIKTIFLMVICAIAAIMFARSKSAYASCSQCVNDAGITDLTEWFETEMEITSYIYMELFKHQHIWFDWTFWRAELILDPNSGGIRAYKPGVLPLFMHAGNQMATIGAFQVMMIGQFMDAQQQLEAQRDLQVMHAQVSKNYYPSVGMCEFATRARGLAGSERKGEANALILSERSTDRLLGNVNTAAWTGTVGDVSSRMAMFQQEFCHMADNNNSLGALCPNRNPNILNEDQKRKLNADIDYQRVIKDPWTIDFDLSDEADRHNPSDGDKSVIAMANNLYGYEAFGRVDHEALLNSISGDRSLDDSTNAQQAYLDLRSVVAKTKVAENSFNALMAMKGSGTGGGGSSEYLQAYLIELGIDKDEVERFLGEKPSYNAQMEILTKKAYQSPLFYTNLYDKPVNVQRKGAAMQAIGLIQKFDLLKSYLRTEASLSVLLELSVLQLQRQVESNIQSFDRQGIVIKRNN